jgi:predicted NodU family carbamoyl transferase
MNILSIWPSHDGCATYIKNNKVVWHTQLDRYNRFKHYPSPSKALIQEFEKIEIDLIILAHNVNNKRNEWFELLHESKKLRNIKLYEYGNQHHHLFHAYCGLTWNQKIRPILVCDGNGTYYEKGIENESLYSFGNHVKTESNKIGARYEAFTFKYFGHGLDCGKTMAWSLHDERPRKLQNDFENDMDNLIEKWEITDAIHFTGGCAQNVLYNSKLLNKFDKVFCDPFNGDFGLSLGAANYYLENKIINDEIYLGIPQDIDASIFSKYNIIDTTPDEVAEILLKEPVAIFQSRSEQGQRGLGNRSLLMSPLHKDSHDRLNKIKKREWFRPFACSVLKEKAKEWFEMPIEESPHMMYVFKIKKENALTAGLSINNDSRIQTVSEKDNSHFYNLIKAFDELVNVPILINTSLNLPGEVLVETMQDLKELFESSELNYIYLPEIGKIIKK